MLTALAVVLATLWLITLLQPSGLAFLQATALRVAGLPISVETVLIALVILAIIAVVRGPIGLAGIILLVFWGLTVVGYTTYQGVALAPMIVFIVIVGTAVHAVTNKSW
ncbi:MAG: hypothetical protein IT305_03365 [Chloroflexi bacterium]|nr:hypothetical protein [Chloroflexota bacterium]